MKMSGRVMLVLAFAAALLQPAVLKSGSAQKPAGGGDYFVYVGTYTGKGSEGIYLYRLDVAAGRLMALGLAAKAQDPSFLALAPDGRHLYAVSEISSFEGKKGGAVSAFERDPKTGSLTFLNGASTRGAGPCFVTVDKTGRDVLVANYGGGSVAVLPIGRDGRVEEASAFIQHTGSSVNPQRQKEPHAHSINVSPDNRFALVADLGLDQVLVYRFDPAKGSLTPNDPPFARVNPGAGPRHLAFHPDGKFAYVINEIQSTITAFTWDAAGGVLKEIQTISTLPAGFSGQSYCADVHVHPTGRFVYGSNRGHDSIAVFAVDPAKGTLTPIENVSTQGKWPRNFGIDPTGSVLIAANERSDNLVVFRIDANTGKLTPAGQSLQLSRPVCVKFVAAR
jgi:6-phosphogluconolactonase